ncbi:M48 family metallopeptidase [Crossiella sp. NPDC003009]
MISAVDAAVAKVGLPVQWSWRVEVRPRRRTLGLTVSTDGSIVIAVPADAEPADVAAAVRSRRLWLARAIKLRTGLAAEHPAIEILDGEGFSYLGRHYRLRLTDDPGHCVALHGGWLDLPQPVSGADGVAAIIDWYTARGQRWLSDRVGSWAGRIGVSSPRVFVTDLGDRWGLRKRDGSVVFHWAAMQLPVELLDLIVVHELVHLVVSRHDEEFRRRVLIALPGAVNLEAKLAEVGRYVWMGALRGA